MLELADIDKDKYSCLLQNIIQIKESKKWKSENVILQNVSDLFIDISVLGSHRILAVKIHRGNVSAQQVA